MFGLFKKKSVNFGLLIKEKKKVVLLLRKDFDFSREVLSQLNSWHRDFQEIIVKTDEYFLRFWESFFKSGNIRFVNKLLEEDKKESIILDFKESSSEIYKFKNSLVLSNVKDFCNFSFSPWEETLPSFAKLFSLNLRSDNLFKKNQISFTSKELILVDLNFDKKVKKLKEKHNVFATKGDPDLEKKDFLEIFELGQRANKIFCFSEKREKLWQLLGFQPTLVEQGQDYAQIL